MLHCTDTASCFTAGGGHTGRPAKTPQSPARYHAEPPPGCLTIMFLQLHPLLQRFYLSIKAKKEGVRYAHGRLIHPLQLVWDPADSGAPASSAHHSQRGHDHRGHSQLRRNLIVI